MWIKWIQNELFVEKFWAKIDIEISFLLLKYIFGRLIKIWVKSHRWILK